MLYESYEDDGVTPLYWETARANEDTFRRVLRHVKLVSSLVPLQFDTEAPIDELLSSVNPANAVGRFAVGDFMVGPREKSAMNDMLSQKVGELASNQAVISYGRYGPQHSAGGVHLYTVVNDEEMRFTKNVESFLD
jgi:hypothetical protein